jgi:translation initiation factor 2D
MALPSDQIENGRKEKGKAVYILHTWKDHLWDMGSKPDLPEPTAFASEPERQESPPPPSEDPTVDDGASPDDDLASPAEPPPAPTYTAGEISTLLHASLLQAISATLAQLPSSAFPLSASVFYESYILPYRPAFPTAVVPLQGVSSPDSDSAPSPQDITIKNSAHKSLTAFLKASEKAGLLALKAPGKHAQQTEVVVTSVNAALPAVAGHHSFVTVKDLELRAAKKAVHEERLKEAEEDTGKLIEAKELWKPHLRSLELFEALGGRSVFSFCLFYEALKALLKSQVAVRCRGGTDAAQWVHHHQRARQRRRAGVHQPGRAPRRRGRARAEDQEQVQGAGRTGAAAGRVHEA